VAVTGHFFPSCGLALGQKLVNFPSDTLQVLLIASGTYTWNANALADVHVSDFLAGSGAGALTEVSTAGTNYTRKTLATVGFTNSLSSPNGYSTLTVSNNPAWSAATFTTSYALFFDNTVGGTDSTNQIICYWDLGGSQAVTAATPFVLALGSLNGVNQGLAQWQSS
jgi:hypothetical protein